jgi:transposase
MGATMVSVGVNLHKTQFTVCVRKNGREKFSVYAASSAGYKTFLKEAAKWQEGGEEVRVAVESTGNTRYFKNRMEDAGISVTVINTLKMKVINESVKKTDKHDAATIAEFLEKDMLPESQICSRESEQLRRLLKARTTLVRAEVVIKNQIHALLTAEGMEDEKGSLQSKRGRQRVLNALKQWEHGLVAQPLVETIEQLEENIKRIEAELRGLAAGDRTVELLMSIPGCGEICAWTIRAYTDDIARFSSAKKYASFAGLAPWVQNSNEKIHHGKITKRGPEELRTAIVQVVMGMRRIKKRTMSWRMMERYEAMKKSKGPGRTIIATARKVSTIIWHMLTDGVEFDIGQMVDKKLAKKSGQMSEVRQKSESALVEETMLEKADRPVSKKTVGESKKKTGVARKKMKKVG